MVAVSQGGRFLLWPSSSIHSFLDVERRRGPFQFSIPDRVSYLDFPACRRKSRRRCYKHQCNHSSHRLTLLCELLRKSTEDRDICIYEYMRKHPSHSCPSIPPHVTRSHT